MDRDQALLLWRSRDPQQLFAESGIAEDLLAQLAGLFEPRSPEEKRLLEQCLRGGRGVERAAFELASALSQNSAKASDLAMSWTLLAALKDHEPAMAALALRLMADATELANPATSVRMSVSPAHIGERHREAVRRTKLAAGWARYAHRSLLHHPQDWRLALAPSEPAPAPAPAAPIVRPDPTAHPMLTVVEEIGAPETEEDSVVQAHQSLTEPVPLKGGAVDPEVLQTALMLEFPHASAAIEHVVGDLRLRRRAGVPWSRFRPLLLAGAPGIGKTRFARRLARLLGTGYGELGVAGSSDNRVLQGTGRGWKNAEPCWPLLVMKRTRCANPILVIDEIDKAVGSHGGDVRATLLGMLEVETAKTWYDECLLAPADLSQISWVLTANDLAAIPAALLSRLCAVHMGHPDANAFDAILEGILRDLAAALSIERALLPALPDKVVAALRRGFLRGASIRRIKQMVEHLVAQMPMGPRVLN